MSIFSTFHFFKSYLWQLQSALLDKHQNVYLCSSSPRNLWGYHWRWAAGRAPMTPGSQRRSVPWRWCSMVPLWALWRVSESSGGENTSWCTLSWFFTNRINLTAMFILLSVNHKWADCGQSPENCAWPLVVAENTAVGDSASLFWTFHYKLCIVYHTAGWI